ncbi:hypothetical protein RIF29_34243 [Crotalaria pallida]|uniref:Reverse transcriptase zinc-binding domain-containing protein n=1 Tax=Crotalaria pallida TaxID=3830 RepID=A0AAN9HUK1_CROPI
MTSQGPLQPLHAHSIWKRIWIVEAIPRVHHELRWRAFHNILPVREKLVDRGVMMDPICLLCGSTDETVIHALVTCSSVIPIRFVTPLAICVNATQDVEFKNWFLSLCSAANIYILNKYDLEPFVCCLEKKECLAL